MSLTNNLPEISFAQKDPLLIEQEMVAFYEGIQNRTLAPADPVLLLLKTITYFLAQQRSAIDFTGKQNLLAYASKDYLDHKGVDLQTERNPAQSASVIIRFTLSAAQAGAITIAAGTRVTAGDNVFFAVRDTAQILPGNLTIDCICECLTAGIVGNDYQAGEINTLVDPIAYVATVVNIDKSAGGIDIEDDESYRERIRIAPEKFTTAGSRDSYRYWARTATQNIIDVSVYRPEAGYVNVVLLMTGGTLPSDPERSLVDEVLNDEKIRPATDEVQVLAPEVVNYDIELSYYIGTSDTVSVATIQNRINTAISDFIAWQKAKIGRDINPSRLIAAIYNAGAKRVTLTLPVTTTIARNEVAIADMDNLAITYGGLEDD